MEDDRAELRTLRKHLLQSGNPSHHEKSFKLGPNPFPSDQDHRIRLKADGRSNCRCIIYMYGVASLLDIPPRAYRSREATPNSRLIFQHRTGHPYLNIHSLAEHYEALEPLEVRCIAECLEIHYASTHGSSLNLVEIAVMSRQCLLRRMLDSRPLCRETVLGRRSEIGKLVRRLAVWRFKRNFTPESKAMMP